MPNTLDSGLNGTLISQAGLDAFVGAFAPMSAFTTDFDPAPASKSDTIQVPYVPAASAAADFAGTYTRQDSTLNKRTITLNKHKFVSWYLSDVAIAKSPAVTLERFGMQKGYQLAKAVFQDVLSAVTLANYGAAAHTGLAANFDYADIVDIKDACDSAEMPEMPRSLVLSSAYYNALLKDSVIKDAGALGATAGPSPRRRRVGAGRRRRVRSQAGEPAPQARRWRRQTRWQRRRRQQQWRRRQRQRWRQRRERGRGSTEGAAATAVDSSLRSVEYLFFFSNKFISYVASNAGPYRQDF